MGPFDKHMERVQRTPPRFLSGAVTELTEDHRIRAIHAAGVDEINAVCYRIGKANSTEPVTIFCRSIRKGLASPPYSFGGSTPADAICVFNPARDGANAELGMGDERPLKRAVPVRCPDCEHNGFHPVLVLQYSEPPDDPAPEEAERPQDFFTWLFLTGSCAKCNAWHCLGDEECA